MLKATVFAIGATLVALPGASWAGQKETDCQHQAAVVAAVQQARLDRVGERKVAAHVTENASWPERFNTAIPLVTPWVYEMKMREVRKADLSAAWLEMCLAQ